MADNLNENQTNTVPDSTSGIKFNAGGVTGTRHSVPFAIVEAYKTIRTNLLFSLPQKKCNRVVITSCNAGEGKSTTAINVAIAFAQLGSKCLLVDGDLRRPSISKKFKIPNNKGLSGVLAGFCEVDEVIQTINPHLDVVTAGRSVPNPTELLGSEMFLKLLDELDEKYDYVFIDTPPVGLVSDSLVIAPNTDGIVFVVQSGGTKHDDFSKAIDSINFINAKLLGAVVNGTENHIRSKYRRYRYYKYYSSYGEKK